MIGDRRKSNGGSGLGSVLLWWALQTVLLPPKRLQLLGVQFVKIIVLEVMAHWRSIQFLPIQRVEVLGSLIGYTQLEFVRAPTLLHNLRVRWR